MAVPRPAALSAVILVIRRSAALLILLALLGLAAGCAWGPVVDTGTTTRTTRSTVLQTVDWGVVDGMLSVRVRNTTDRTLEHATTDIVVTDSSGTAQSTGAPDSDPCCTILNLPPGGEFGLYLDLGSMNEDIAGVDVAYRDISWLPASAGTATTLTAGRTHLTAGDSESVVTAHIKAHGDSVRVIVGQAFLTDPTGKFMAVVSGRFDCFTEDRSRTVEMQLFHAVPPGTRVQRVVAYALPDDAPGAVDSCSDS
jgi:hypothetical protein